MAEGKTVDEFTSIELQQSASSTAPADARCSGPVFDISMHPHHNIVAAGIVSGTVEVHAYAQDSCSCMLSLNHHSRSCRAVAFSRDGNALYSGSLDLSVAAVNTEGTLFWQNSDAHTSPVQTIVEVPSSATAFATGDEAGTFHIFDTRQSAPVFSINCHSDYISDIVFDKDCSRAITAGGDGRIACLNLRKGKPMARSEQLEDEQLSAALLKGGKKIVIGTQSGAVNIWSWGNWDNISDRIVGHPQSVQSIVKYDEDTILTGSEDGIIRIVGVHPNRMHGMVGEHDEDFPVESLALSSSKNILASISHDETIKFWNVSYLAELESNVESGISNTSNCGMSAVSDHHAADTSTDSFFADL